jgi:inner membrane protein|tara:strand:- start:6 stop:572 length:567 start_codon:yes stop_codon:yes gene_type:complete
MLIAHAPAGYVLSKIMMKLPKKSSKLYLVAGLTGSVICDADLIYQFYYDDMSVNHHDYWTHIPYYWSFFLVVPILSWVFSKRLSIASSFFLAGVFLHLTLDSVLTGIKWKYPVDDSYIGIIPISDVKVLVSPTKIHHLFENEFISLGVRGWMYNFGSHWTFNIEIAICTAAFLLLVLSSIKSNILSNP